MNLDPKKYELCYSNKILDLRQSVGLSNLPNNATLAIRPITKARDQSVTVCVQLEGSERQIGEFDNNQSLWEIIGTLFPDKVLDLDPNTELKCLYMRTEVSGIDRLQETKLNSLGIISGKVAIKLKIGNFDQLNEPSTSKSTEQSKISKFTKEFNQNMSEKVSSLQSNLVSKFELFKKKVAAKKKGSDQNQLVHESNENILEAESEKFNYEISDQLIEILVNDHKVVLFSQDDKQRMTSTHEISDDFFEITKEDVRIMYSDLQKHKSSLEERPLETQKLREQRLNKEAKKYGFTLIRLSFPYDHLVLQTTFKPDDKIEELVNFAKEVVSVDDFYLYTAPPKKVLDLKSTFFKERLCPAALIQFGGHQGAVLKDEYKQKISSFLSVVNYTSYLRGKFKNSDQELDKIDDSQMKQQSSDQQTMDRAKKEERLKKLLMKK